MSFRPNYGSKPAFGAVVEQKEGEEKKPRAYGQRRNQWKKGDVSEDQKNFQAMIGVEDLSDVEGIIRYDVMDMIKLKEKNTTMPEIVHDDCVIGYERLCEMLDEHESTVAEREYSILAAVGAAEFVTEVPNTIRVDPRVRTLRNIMNQFTMDNPELITDMLGNNLDQYISEPDVLLIAVDAVITKCCSDHLFCDAFVAILRVVIEHMTTKNSLAFKTALLTCCQSLYQQEEPVEEWKKMKGDLAKEAKSLYETTRNNFFHFLGVLFINELIHLDIILRVLVDLSHDYPEKVTSVTYFITLVRVIGSVMEREVATKLTIDEIFRSLHLWQEEKIISPYMVEEIRAVRNLKDAKWVVAVEIDKNMESTVTDDWEKTVATRHSRKGKETFVENSAELRANNELILFCKNLWIDYVCHFVVEDVVEEVERFDEVQQEVFVFSSIKCLISRSDIEQRRAGILLNQLLDKETVRDVVFLGGFRRILEEYARMRKTNKNMLASFRNMYFPLIQEEHVTIRMIVDLWKNKDHFDGFLAELIFDLMNTWKTVNKEMAAKYLADAKLTVSELFVGGCPAIVAMNSLKKHGMKEVEEIISFA